jgi:hypothetical protein
MERLNGSAPCAEQAGVQFVPDAAVDRSLRLFRFQDFTKYVATLDQRALYFTAANHLADPYEGVRSKHAIDAFSGCAEPGEELKRSVLVNSWHANAHESAAMWRIYLKSDEGVAIETSVERLTDAFASTDDALYMGAVRYLDYERDEGPGGGDLGPFFCKRKAYEYEREVRLVARCGATPGEGRYVACDLGRLIERVVLSPGAHAWFGELVSSVTRHYGFDFRIETSELARSPQDVST